PKALTMTASPAVPLEAGTCYRYTVTRLDAQGMPAVPNSPTTVTLSAAPQGVAFFIDAACLTPTNSVDIQRMLSSADFYVKGLTGRAAPYDLSVWSGA